MTAASLPHPVVRLASGEHPAESVIDVAAASDAMDTGKARLHHLIRAQMVDAGINALIRGVPVGRLDVTPAMVAVLEDLNAAGRVAARREIRALLGATPERYADASTSVPSLRGVVFRLAGFLDGLRPRVTQIARDARTSADISGVVTMAARRRLEQMPGALDAASRVVSRAYISGLHDIYAANQHLFDGWGYTSVLDGGTCDRCRARHGETYTYAEAMRVMPGFGPNPDCEGRGRCRCRLFAIPPTRDA